MPTKSTSKKSGLKDIIGANVADEVAEEFHAAMLKRDNKILSFWSLDNDTVNVEPLKRYHVGHLVYMLFVAKLLSTKNCVVEANICDSYSLKSDLAMERSRFFNPHKSWREGRIRRRSFLDKAFLEAEDRFVIFNLRDEFQKGNNAFQKLYNEARNVWGETKKLLDDHGKALINGTDYRYPNRVDGGNAEIKKFHSLLRRTLWKDITMPETVTLLFILAHKPSWLESHEWTSKCIAFFASKFIRNKNTEFILEGERNCYSWRFHLLLAKIVAARNRKNTPDFKKIRIIPFRDIPDINNANFMAQKQEKYALLFGEILDAIKTSKKFRQFQSNGKTTIKRIHDLLESLDTTNSISSSIVNIAAKLSDYPRKNIQVLHVSDIHYGAHFSFGVKESEVKWSPTEKLPKYLQRRLPMEKPHFLFVSGDFTSVCKKSEFKQAERFIVEILRSDALQKLPEHDKIAKHQIMAVPGNHDFAWDLKSKNQANNFNAFITNTGIMSPWTDSSTICKVIRPPNGVPLRMMYFEDLGLAIALACSTTGTLTSADKTRQYGKLRKSKKKLSDEQWNIVRELLNQDEPEFPPTHQAALSHCIEELYGENGGESAELIFVSHHHVCDVDHETRSSRGTKNIKAILSDANAILWLHGHIHVPYLHTTEHGLTICGAGTLGGWTAQGHSANIIHIGISNDHGNYLSKLEFNMLKGSFRLSSFDEE